jgi:predicted Rdx family selenoprotein
MSNRLATILTSYLNISVAGELVCRRSDKDYALDITFRLHRATWTSTELFLTFPLPKLKAISLLPLNSDETSGRFRVWLYLSDEPPILLWDRKVEGGFPELKVLVSAELDCPLLYPCPHDIKM